MKEKIIETIKKNGLLSGCAGLVLCVSGGADSMCLLHFFLTNKELFGVPFVVAHVNHGLREESEKEEANLRAYCSEKGVPIEVLRADIKHTKPQGRSTEEYSREIRYEFFEKVRVKYGYSHIATAHNADDNTETVLLNMIRGCGITGLRGIPIKREDNIIRPLLRCTKEEIYAYCAENGIKYATDKTNFESVYTRNIIRNDILPLIRKINPSFGEAVFRLSASAIADDKYLENVIDGLMEGFGEFRKKNELPLSHLQDLPESLLSRLLRRYFFVNSPKTVLTNKQTSDIIYLISEAKTSEKTVIGNLEISRGYGVLKISEKGDAEKSGILPSELHEGMNILPGTGILTVSEVIADIDNRKNSVVSGLELSVRSRAAGDSIKLPGRPKKALRRLFIDNKMPEADRSSVPVVVYGGRVAWLYGYGTDESFIPEIGCPAYYLEFTPDKA